MLAHVNAWSTQMASAEEWDRGASVQRRAQILYAHYHPAMLGYRSIHIEEYCMTLKHLGQNSALPTSPEEAVLDYVGNPRPGRPYLVRDRKRTRLNSSHSCA